LGFGEGGAVGDRLGEISEEENNIITLMSLLKVHKDEIYF
jgi:hypothetical protein